MNPLKILIVEDQAEESAQLSETLHQLGYEVAGIAKDAEDAERIYRAARPDLVLIDIYINQEPQGIVFAAEVARDGVPFIFLTSSYDRSTFQLARQTGPHSYLLKPYNPVELGYAVELAISPGEEVSVPASDLVFVKKGNTVYKLYAADIDYVEVDGKYCRLAYQDQKFVVQQSLKHLEAVLSGQPFLRIHRNCMANLKKIVRIDTAHHEVFLASGGRLPVSRRYLDELIRSFRVLS